MISVIYLLHSLFLNSFHTQREKQFCSTLSWDENLPLPLDFSWMNESPVLQAELCASPSLHTTHLLKPEPSTWEWLYLEMGWFNSNEVISVGPNPTGLVSLWKEGIWIHKEMCHACTEKSVRGNSQKPSQVNQSGPGKNQPWPHLDHGLPASGTVRK